MIVYFETSALIKLLVEEEHSEVCTLIWDAAALRMTSRLSYPEARAALAEAMRSGRLTRGGLRKVKQELASRVDEMTIIEATGDIASRAGDIAEAHALGGYDALHLASALATETDDVVMATWDDDLIRAAGELSLGVATR